MRIHIPMNTNKRNIDNGKSTVVSSKNKPLSAPHTVIKLKTISTKDRQELRIPSYEYLLP